MLALIPKEKMAIQEYYIIFEVALLRQSRIRTHNAWWQKDERKTG